jgi:hypothetical protein
MITITATHLLFTVVFVFIAMAVNAMFPKY